MKLGVLLPTFRDQANDALAAADDAEALGLDGVFAFDHLWPMGSPTRPSFAPLPVLAAVASRTKNLRVGTLVARVGMVGTATLVDRFLTLEALAPGRLIAGVGTGDDLSKDELLAYGLDYASADERRELLSEALAALVGRVAVWCGGGAAATNDVAWSHGATLNLWGASPARVRDAARRGPVTWAGPLDGDVTATLDELAAAGAQWAVVTPSTMMGELAKWRGRA